MMKNYQIFVTILVLSIYQWSVIAVSVELNVKETQKTPLEPTNAPDDITTAQNTTTIIPDTTTATTSTVEPTTPTTTTTTKPPTTTPKPQPTTSTVTPTTTTTTTTTTKTTTEKPTPEPCNGHFNGPSFIGGIVLTIGMIAIGFVAHKIYKSKFDRNYHTL